MINNIISDSMQIFGSKSSTSKATDTLSNKSLATSLQRRKWAATRGVALT